MYSKDKSNANGQHSQADQPLNFYFDHNGADISTAPKSIESC